MCDGFRENQNMHCLWKCPGPGASPEGEQDLGTEVRFNGTRRWLHMSMLLHDRLIGNAVGGCWYSLQWSDPVRRLQQEWVCQHVGIKSATHSFTLRLVGVQRRDCLDFSHSLVILNASLVAGPSRISFSKKGPVNATLQASRLKQHVKQHLLLLTFATEVFAMFERRSRKGECPKPYHWQWPRLLISFCPHPGKDLEPTPALQADAPNDSVCVDFLHFSSGSFSAQQGADGDQAGDQRRLDTDTTATTQDLEKGNAGVVF